MASGDNFVLSIPDQTVEWKKTCRNIQHGAGRLLGGTRIHDSDTAIMPGECKRVSTWGEAHAVNPTGRVV